MENSFVIWIFRYAMVNSRFTEMQQLWDGNLRSICCCHCYITFIVIAANFFFPACVFLFYANVCVCVWFLCNLWRKWNESTKQCALFRENNFLCSATIFCWILKLHSTNKLQRKQKSSSRERERESEKSGFCHHNRSIFYVW